MPFKNELFRNHCLHLSSNVPGILKKFFFIPPATYPVLFFNETAGAAQEWFSDQAGDSFPSRLLAFEGKSGIQAGTTARLESSCFPSIGCLGGNGCSYTAGTFVQDNLMSRGSGLLPGLSLTWTEVQLGSKAGLSAGCF